MVLTQQSLHDLLSLPQVQDLLVSGQQRGQLLRAAHLFLVVFIQSGVVNAQPFHLFITVPHEVQRVRRLVEVSKPYHRKWNLLTVVAEVLQSLKNTVNGMVVIGRKQHGALVKESRHDGVENGVCFASPRRSLNICQRILHGVVDSQQLVQIHPAVHQCNGIRFPTDRPPENISEKSPDGSGYSSFLIHVDDGVVLVPEVQRNIRTDSDDVGHVIHHFSTATVVCNAVLDALQILFGLLQQYKIICVQKLTRTYGVSLNLKLMAQRDAFGRPHGPVLYVQVQLAVCQHIESLLTVDAEDIQGQLPDMCFFLFGVRLVLKIFDDLRELLATEIIGLSPEVLSVKVLHQRIFAAVRRRVQAIAVTQVIQDLQVGHAVKKAPVLLGVQPDISDQCLIHRAIRAVQYSGTHNGINVNT